MDQMIFDFNGCLVAGCEKPVKGGGYCGMHYTRLKRDGIPGEPGQRRRGRRSQPKPECSIDGCEKIQSNLKLALCETHRAKNKKLMRVFNITLWDYLKIWKNQQEKCAICLRDEGIFHVDHCHETLKVRGILCHHCNTGLGNLQDNVALLERAIEYLKG